MSEDEREELETIKRKRVQAGQAAYKHATLGDISDEIAELLAQNGLTVDWETSQERDQVTVTCVVSWSRSGSRRRPR